ncbi:MAG TPA: proton-conducting transporter membrane subunit [Bryobacteraceae bacterium]
MLSDLLILTAILWVASFVLALIERSGLAARVCLVLGCAAGIVFSIGGLNLGIAPFFFPIHLADASVLFRLDAPAFWLFLFGIIPALLAMALSTSNRSPRPRRYWMAGTALALLGALGVFGLQDALSFLIAWEVMSFGGAVMILAEHVHARASSPTLFMLALLEVGAVALMLALLLLSNQTNMLSFAGFSGLASSPKSFLVGLLLLIGFGAKLGLLPFYEWFPAAYGSGSGATGVIFSGVVLNAAFFGLQRGACTWLPKTGGWSTGLAIVFIVVSVLSAILAILYAFQEEDWRRLLSFSSAENASVAIATLGISLLLSANSHPVLAALAWNVALLHLAGHSLAKGALFLTADGVFHASGEYLICQRGLLRRTSTVFGIGAVFAAMSLAALPPQAGFVSEWYIFQTLFQATQATTLVSRLTLALAAAGLALTAAVALATFVKLFGIGLLGDGYEGPAPISGLRSGAVFVLGLCVLGLAVGMPWWLPSLSTANLSLFGANAAASMRDGLLLVPLSNKFAFISPTKLVIAMPLLSLVPIGLILAGRGAGAPRRAPIWYGGLREKPREIATTSLAFSNALRTFYGFIYGPTHDIAREYHHAPYFVKRLVFNQELAPIFGPYLFTPLVRIVRFLATGIRALQSGYLNFYNALIGILLILILALALLSR